MAGTDSGAEAELAATEKRDLEAVNKENTILRNLLERLGFKKEMERELSQKNTKQTEVIR